MNAKSTKHLFVSVLTWGMTAQAGAQAPGADYLNTPFGWFHKDCVSLVDDSTHVDERVDVPSGDIGSICAHKNYAHRYSAGGNTAQVTTNGWAAYALAEAQQTSKGIRHFTGLEAEWRVPKPPEEWPSASDPNYSSAVVFLFPSLQSRNASGTYTSIIQPVLQYGVSAAGGGDRWTLASWYVNGVTNRVFTSYVIDVQPGDLIRGTIESSNCTSAGDCDWFIQAQPVGGGPRSSAHLSTTADAFVYNIVNPGVLEVYAGDSCDMLPPGGETIFENVRIFEGDSVTWGIVPHMQYVVNQGNPFCGFSVSVGFDDDEGNINTRILY